MSKFAKALVKRNVGIVARGPNMMNQAGGLAYQDTPAIALYKQVATSLWSGDGYYEKQQQWFERFQANVSQAISEDVQFPFKLAAYARDKSGLALRTSPIGLYAEASVNKASMNTGLARRYASKVILRADEPGEVLAYLKLHHNDVVPHGVVRGIADTLPNFNEYQLAKYKDGLRNVIRLTRPKPKTDEQRTLWGRAVSNTLEVPYTWEVELSKAQGDDEKRAVWNQLLKSGKLGIFALVRNIRNIAKAGADIEEALSQVTEKRVIGSGILPFQWYKAYKAISESVGESIAEPMQQAIAWSLRDVPRMGGTTLIACDNSGSMSTVTATRGMTNAEIGNLMGAMALYVSEQGIASTFGQYFAIANTNPKHGLFYNKQLIDQCGKTTGHSTDAWRIFEYLIHSGVQVDRVIIFSDLQCYDSSHRWSGGGHSLSTELESYRQSVNPNVRVYSVNLASQDNSTQFAPEQNVTELAGWSESIFQYITAMEAGDLALSYIKSNF